MASVASAARTDYDDDFNHRQWLESVREDLRLYVPGTIAAWDAKADIFNKWSALGWDERDALLREHVAANLSV